MRSSPEPRSHHVEGRSNPFLRLQIINSESDLIAPTNSQQPARAVDNKEYEPAFSDVSAENATLIQAPFTDYDQNTADVTVENAAYKHVPFTDYDNQAGDAAAERAAFQQTPFGY